MTTRLLLDGNSKIIIQKTSLRSRQSYLSLVTCQVCKIMYLSHKISKHLQPNTNNTAVDQPICYIRVSADCPMILYLERYILLFSHKHLVKMPPTAALFGLHTGTLNVFDEATKQKHTMDSKVADIYICIDSS